jgi:hypothetical protein
LNYTIVPNTIPISKSPYMYRDRVNAPAGARTIKTRSKANEVKELD